MLFYEHEDIIEFQNKFIERNISDHLMECFILGFIWYQTLDLALDQTSAQFRPTLHVRHLLIRLAIGLASLFRLQNQIFF